MVHITFEQFLRHTNAEELIINKLKEAGPRLYELNYDRRHKHCKLLYKKFYDAKLRDSVLKYGLILKPMPNSFKSQFLLFPQKNNNLGECNSIDTAENKSEQKIKNKSPPLEDKYKDDLPSTSSAITHKTRILPCDEKKTSTKAKLKSKSKKQSNSKTGTNFSTTNKILTASTLEKQSSSKTSAKITNYFASHAINYKVDETRNPKVLIKSRKRILDPKNEKIEMKPQSKRSKMSPSMKVDTTKKEPEIIKNKTDLLSSKTNLEENNIKEKKKNKCDEKKNKIIKNPAIQCSDDVASDDCDINTNDSVIIIPDRKFENNSSPAKSALPKRNRNEDYRKTSKISIEDNLLKSPEKEKTPEKRLSRDDIKLWIAEGQKALNDNKEDNKKQCKETRPGNSKASRENIHVGYKLQTITAHPDKVKKYIKYWLKFEIQMRKGINLQATTVTVSEASDDKILSALTEMTYEDFKNLIDAQKWTSLGRPIDELENHYTAFIRKEKSWPAVYIGLTKLLSYLNSKGVRGSISLKNIPPRLLSFDDVLEKTNIKEWMSLSCDEPPESYKELLILCKKEYENCCYKDAWNEGLKFNDNTEEDGSSQDMSIELFTEASLSLSLDSGNIQENDSIKDSTALQNLENSGKKLVLRSNQNEFAENSKDSTTNAATRHRKSRKWGPKSRRMNSSVGDDDLENQMNNICGDAEQLVLKNTIERIVPIDTQELNQILEHNPTKLSIENRERIPNSKKGMEKVVDNNDLKIQINHIFENAEQPVLKNTNKIDTQELNRILTSSQTQSLIENTEIISHSKRRIEKGVESNELEIQISHLCGDAEQLLKKTVEPMVPIDTQELNRILSNSQTEIVIENREDSPNSKEISSGDTALCADPITDSVEKVFNKNQEGVTTVVQQSVLKTTITSGASSLPLGTDNLIPPLPNIFEYCEESNTKCSHIHITNDTSPPNVVSKEKPLQSTAMGGKISTKNDKSDLISSSPNLFQLSEESYSKCHDYQSIIVQTQESVYVPCESNHGFNTEQNNFSLNMNEASESEDPFGKTIASQEKAVVIRSNHSSVTEIYDSQNTHLCEQLNVLDKSTSFDGNLGSNVLANKKTQNFMDSEETIVLKRLLLSNQTSETVGSLDSNIVADKMTLNVLDSEETIVLKELSLSNQTGEPSEPIVEIPEKNKEHCSSPPPSSHSSETSNIVDDNTTEPASSDSTDAVNAHAEIGNTKENDNSVTIVKSEDRLPDVINVALISAKTFQNLDKNPLKKNLQSIQPERDYTSINLMCFHKATDIQKDLNEYGKQTKEKPTLDHNTEKTTEKSVNNIETDLSPSAHSTKSVKVIVKREIFSEHFSQYDDDVEIIEIPQSEAMVIDDEETAPELLEALLCSPQKTKHLPMTVVNTSISQPISSSSTYLDNFPQAQQFPSNFDLTQSPSNLNQSSEIGHSSDQQIFKTPHNKSKKNIPAGAKKSKYMEKTLVYQFNKASCSSKSKNDMQLSEEMSEMSYVSIEPQNIPSDIELTQTCLDESTNQKQKKSLETISLSKGSVEKAEKVNKVSIQEGAENNIQGSGVSMLVCISNSFDETNKTSMDLAKLPKNKEESIKLEECLDINHTRKFLPQTEESVDIITVETEKNKTGKDFSLADILEAIKELKFLFEELSGIDEEDVVCTKVEQPPVTCLRDDSLDSSSEVELLEDSSQDLSNVVSFEIARNKVEEIEEHNECFRIPSKKITQAQVEISIENENSKDKQLWIESRKDHAETVECIEADIKNIELLKENADNSVEIILSDSGDTEFIEVSEEEDNDNGEKREVTKKPEVSSNEKETSRNMDTIEKNLYFKVTGSTNGNRSVEVMVSANGPSDVELIKVSEKEVSAPADCSAALSQCSSVRLNQNKSIKDNEGKTREVVNNLEIAFNQKDNTRNRQTLEQIIYPKNANASSSVEAVLSANDSSDVEFIQLSDEDDEISVDCTPILSRSSTINKIFTGNQIHNIEDSNNFVVNEGNRQTVEQSSPINHVLGSETKTFEVLNLYDSGAKICEDTTNQLNQRFIEEVKSCLKEPIKAKQLTNGCEDLLLKAKENCQDSMIVVYRELSNVVIETSTSAKLNEKDSVIEKLSTKDAVSNKRDISKTLDCDPIENQSEQINVINASQEQISAETCKNLNTGLPQNIAVTSLTTVKTSKHVGNTTVVYSDNDMELEAENCPPNQKIASDRSKNQSAFTVAHCISSENSEGLLAKNVPVSKDIDEITEPTITLQDHDDKSEKKCSSICEKPNEPIDEYALKDRFDGNSEGRTQIYSDKSLSISSFGVINSAENTSENETYSQSFAKTDAIVFSASTQEERSVSNQDDDEESSEPTYNSSRELNNLTFYYISSDDDDYNQNDDNTIEETSSQTSNFKKVLISKESIADASKAKSDPNNEELLENLNESCIVPVNVSSTILYISTEIPNDREASTHKSAKNKDLNSNEIENLCNKSLKVVSTKNDLSLNLNKSNDPVISNAKTYKKHSMDCNPINQVIDNSDSNLENTPPEKPSNVENVQLSKSLQSEEFEENVAVSLKTDKAIYEENTEDAINNPLIDPINFDTGNVLNVQNTQVGVNKYSFEGQSLDEDRGHSSLGKNQSNFSNHLKNLQEAVEKITKLKKNVNRKKKIVSDWSMTLKLSQTIVVPQKPPTTDLQQFNIGQLQPVNNSTMPLIFSPLSNVHNSEVPYTSPSNLQELSQKSSQGITEIITNNFEPTTATKANTITEIHHPQEVPQRLSLESFEKSTEITKNNIEPTISSNLKTITKVPETNLFQQLSEECAKMIEKSVAPTTSAKLENITLQGFIPIATLQNIQTSNEDFIEVPVMIEKRLLNILPPMAAISESIQPNGSQTTQSLKINVEFKLDEQQLGCPAKDPIPMSHDKLKPQNINLISGNEAGTKNTKEEVAFKGNILHKTLSKKLPIRLEHKPKTKILQPPISKKKTTPKKSSKLPDFVQQKTHAFPSIPLKPCDKPIKTKPPSLLTVEECDFLIEDASQTSATPTTVSQILGTDCTYFENSELLRNLDKICAPHHPEVPALQIEQLPPQVEESPPTTCKVTNSIPITLSEGVTARKVWQVNLQWKSQKAMSIEVQFSVNRRSMTVCDESAKLLFNFTPEIWSDIHRVLREIDHFEYKRRAFKNNLKTTSLHKVLRQLFNSSIQVVDVKLINDSYNPYTICEKTIPVYRKPFQCLTKGIAPDILRKMSFLKQSLQNNNNYEVN